MERTESCAANERKQMLEDLGQSEVEISLEGEVNCNRQKANCQKNPGHVSFIPVREFSMDHLPPAYQSQELLEFVDTVSKLTAKVSVHYISMNRPKGYPLFKCRGRSVLRTATGIVSDVIARKIHQNDGELCPCEKCQEAASPSPTWGLVHMNTAKHVIYDDSEVKKTVVRLFYDEEGQDASELYKLYGFRCLVSNGWADWCTIECITHDTVLCSRLQELAPLLHKGYTNLLMKHITNPSLIVIIVSHPHGCSKQVTIGENVMRQINREIFESAWTSYTYSTATCRGSSGSFVCILGAIGGHYKELHVHSDFLKNGLNKSGIAIEFM